MKKKKKKASAPLDPTERLLTDWQAAKVLGVSATIVRRLARERGLRHVLLGKNMQFRMSWLIDYVEKHAEGGKPDA